MPQCNPEYNKNDDGGKASASKFFSSVAGKATSENIIHLTGHYFYFKSN